MAITSKKSGVFYGWWLLGAGTVVMMMQGGLYAYGFPAFFVPLASTLGASRGALSLAFSFTRLESSLLGPIEGYMIDRFGPRGIMYVGFALLGLSFILFSFVDSLLGFYLVFPIIALGASLSGFLPVITAVNNWFSRRRGLATGISSAGVNMGGVLVAVVAVSISLYGWRTTAVVIGVVIWLLGFPLAAMMRHKPQPYGYLTDGDDPVEQGDSSADGRPSGADETADFTPMQALKTPAFWFIASAHGFSLFIVGSVSIHQIPLLVDAGISFQTASTILAFMTLVAMVGRVAGGWLGDKLGRKFDSGGLLLVDVGGSCGAGDRSNDTPSDVVRGPLRPGLRSKGAHTHRPPGGVLWTEELRHHNGSLPTGDGHRLLLRPHSRRVCLRRAGKLSYGVLHHSRDQPRWGGAGLLHQEARYSPTPRGRRSVG